MTKESRNPQKSEAPPLKQRVFAAKITHYDLIFGAAQRRQADGSFLSWRGDIIDLNIESISEHHVDTVRLYFLPDAESHELREYREWNGKVYITAFLPAVEFQKYYQALQSERPSYFICVFQKLRTARWRTCAGLMLSPPTPDTVRPTPRSIFHLNRH